MKATLRFAPVVAPMGYASWVRHLSGHSGVYVLRSIRTGQILYVGESHTGRLYETLTRHFQRWERQHYNVYDKRGGRRGGNVYDAADTEAAAIVCPASGAVNLQYDVIQQLDPADNVVTGAGVADFDDDDDDDDIPF